MQDPETEHPPIHYSWVDLPEEVFFEVLRHLPNKLADALAVCGVCHAWRDSVVDSKELMCRLRVRFSAEGPTRTHVHMRKLPHPPLNTHNSKRPERLTLPVPRILRAMSVAGNLEGTVTLARVHDLRGSHTRAMLFWKQAAKAGAAEAQYRIGEAFYQGEGDVGQDCEEALVWLQRVAKNPECDSELLASAATILGYLHMDGEGTKIDNIQATKWFAIGKANGNKEAEQTLGWMYNTGQYG